MDWGIFKFKKAKKKKKRAKGVNDVSTVCVYIEL